MCGFDADSFGREFAQRVGQPAYGALAVHHFKLRATVEGTKERPSSRRRIAVTARHTSGGPRMKASISLCLALEIILLSGCAKAESVHQANCSPPDNLQWVAGNEECLRIRTLNEKLSVSNPVLVIFLHGNVTSGGPASYFFERAIWFERRDVVPVVLIRPGYYDDQGNRSTGNHFGRADNWTAHNVDAVADAVRNLKQQHRASRVVLVGHSGGAATAGVILGRHPGVADAAVLAACPCNVSAWRLMRGGRMWTSLSPHSYAERVPKGTEVIALTGSDDSVTVPSLGRNYAMALQSLGVSARFELVPGVSHNRIVVSKPFYDAIWELIARE